MNRFKTTVLEAIKNDELFELMSADPKYTLDKDGNYKIGPDLRLMVRQLSGRGGALPHHGGEHPQERAYQAHGHG